MSSPPSNKSCNRAGLFKRPVHSSASSRWPQALVQNRKQLRLRSFVLAAWPSCRGPRQPAANELGGGPVRHVLSPSSNAWPARRRQARPCHIPRPTSLRALHRVPSNVVLRAYLPGPHSVEASGSAFPIKTGSEFPIGIKGRQLAENAECDHLPDAQRLPVGPTARAVRTQEHCPRLVPALGCSRDLRANLGGLGRRV